MSTPHDVADLYAEDWAHVVGLLVSVGASRADAEEVAQGAFEKLLRSGHRVTSQEHARSWVRTVAVRDLVSRHRHSRVAWRKRAAIAELEWTEGPTENAAARIDVRKAMESLSMDHRAALLLHYVEDLSVADIATALGVSKGTVKSRLSRARASLAPYLEEPAEDRP